VRVTLVLTRMCTATVRASKILYVPVAGTRTRVLVHVKWYYLGTRAHVFIIILLREKWFASTHARECSTCGTKYVLRVAVLVPAYVGKPVLACT
jgi:hypothetical protein